jgi:hypothetical protein
LLMLTVRNVAVTYWKDNYNEETVSDTVLYIFF